MEMNDLHVFIVVALAFQFQLSKGQGGSLSIHLAEHYVASIGDNATFTCSVTGRRSAAGRLGIDLLWQKSGQKLKRCSSQPTDDPDGFEEHCELSITPVRRTSEGMYECVLLYLTSSRKTLQLDVVEPNTRVEVTDLETGQLVPAGSEPICIPGSDCFRGFQCTLRDAEPNAWDISWIVGGQRVVTGGFETRAGGLVTVRSILNVSKSQEELPSNLTCQAMGQGRLLSITVELESCHEPITTVEITDLKTGQLLPVGSEPICIPESDGFRGFQCTLRDAEPNAWDISWIVGEQRVVTGAVETGAGGLVTVRSILNVSKSQEDLPRNLTCQAMGQGRLLSITVELESCHEPNTTVEVIDLKTGQLVPAGSEPICISASDGFRGFQCTLRDAEPNAWYISWIVRGQRVVTGANETRAGGLVTVRSILNVSKSQEELPRNLTCQAMGLGRLLSITVELESCHTMNPVPSLELRDLSTGRLVGLTPTPICIEPETERRFQCQLEATQAGVWDIAWLIDGKEAGAGFNNFTGSATSGSAIGNSRLIALTWRNDDSAKSLTCRATSLEGESLNVALHFETCLDDKVLRSGVNLQMLFIVVSVLCGLLVVIVAALAISLSRSKRSYQPPLRAPSVKDLQAGVEMESLASDAESNTTAGEGGYLEPNVASKTGFSRDTGLPSWAEGFGIPWGDLYVEEQVLGSGNFGEVRYGTVMKDGDLNRAAIKMLKGNVSVCDRDDFMDELWTMACIGDHPNIVQLLGACQHQGVLYVALEYLPYGDLRSYLRTARSESDTDQDALSSQQLVKFALDVAKGMEHLAKAKVIHRDLAARNILIGTGLIAKVSDFGLSRGENIYVQTSRRRVPLRWLSIESVRHQLYTTQSDVWSFGILLWEITTFGGTPYPTVPNDLLIEKIKKGYRMHKPDNCHDQIYALMRECWDEDPNNRPTFTDLVYILSDMADDRIKHTYIAVDRSEYQNLSVILPEFDGN